MSASEQAQLRQLQAQVERLQQQINTLTTRLVPVEKDLVERKDAEAEKEPPAGDPAEYDDL